MNALFFAIAVAWLVYGGHGLFAERRLAREGVALDAKVKGHEHDGYQYYPLLGYTYQGTYYEVRSRLGAKEKYQQGSLLPVKILPARPDRPQIVGRSNRRAYLFALAIGLIALVWAAWLAIPHELL